jgi:hypothetical protein
MEDSVGVEGVGNAGVAGSLIDVGVAGNVGKAVRAPVSGIVRSPSGGGTIGGNGTSGTAGRTGTMADASPIGSRGRGSMAGGESARAGMRL